MSKAKTYHQYDDRADNSNGGPLDQFYVLSSSFAYGGGCGGEGAGVEEFPHMLAALESQLSWLSGFEPDDFDAGDYEEQTANLEAAIREINDRKTDKGVRPTFLSIDGNRVGYCLQAEGYWEQFVPAALSIFVDDLKAKIEDSSEDDEDIADLQAELDRVMALSRREDSTSADFVDEFMSAREAYDQRHS